MKRLILIAGLCTWALPAVAQDNDSVCFYGEDKFTIVFELRGTEEGTVTEYVDECGMKRVEVKETEMSVMGFSQTTSQRIIYDRDQIITVDSQTGQTTITTNPMWQNIYDSMAQQNMDGLEFGERFIRGMGGAPTGEQGNFANTVCDWWQVTQLGSDMCVTPWGATLMTRTNFMGLSSEREATAITMGDSGSPDLFDYDPSQAQTMPNLQDLMQQMNQGNQ